MNFQKDFQNQKSNHSIKSKCLKWVVKKILPTIYDMKNTQPKMKAIKTGKEIGIMFGV